MGGEETIHFRKLVAITSLTSGLRPNYWWDLCSTLSVAKRQLFFSRVSCLPGNRRDSINKEAVSSVASSIDRLFSTFAQTETAAKKGRFFSFFSACKKGRQTRRLPWSTVQLRTRLQPFMTELGVRVTGLVILCLCGFRSNFDDRTTGHTSLEPDCVKIVNLTIPKTTLTSVVRPSFRFIFRRRRKTGKGISRSGQTAGRSDPSDRY